MAYIELEAAKDAIIQYIAEQTVSKYPSAELCKASRMGAEGVIYELETLPTADVEEVVRCKDCTKRGTFRCVKSKGEHPTTTKNTEFCCWGERKEDA